VNRKILYGLLAALLCGPVGGLAAENPAEAVPATKPATKPAAQAGRRVEREAFVYEAPAGWSMFNNEMRSSFAIASFFNAGGEMIQLSVSGKLTPEQFAGARERLRAAQKVQARHGWMLARSGSAELPPHGTVDEAVYFDEDNRLTSFAYNVFGPERIALFTITFKGIKPDVDEAARAARPMLDGLRWK
jgi:hypothetical protein